MKNARRIFIAVAGAVAMVGVLAVSTTANASPFCNGWKNTCLKRCPDCSSSCAAKASACESTGCFTEGAKFGGATHCKSGAQNSRTEATPAGGRRGNRGR